MAEPLPEWAAEEFRRSTAGLKLLLFAGLTAVVANAAAAVVRAFAGPAMVVVLMGVVAVAAGVVALVACVRLFRSLRRFRGRLQVALLSAGDSDG